MASPSSFTSCNYKFNVFSSFHGPDVRKTLLSHMCEQFKRNGITMFDDQEIVRSEEIAPSLTEAIGKSRISIVILSKKYASSGWCLDELVEIMKRKETMGQIVMNIFYGVKPSDVRVQTGDFGIAFSETCAHKTDEERQKWSKALSDVGNIAGEDFQKWDNEANMIKKISKDVSDKLNATPSRDFDGMVGLEAHLRVMESLLDLDSVGVKMVGIFGPAGIGKTTIARALHSRLSNKFQLTCFMENLRESYHKSGLDDYGLQLRLQEQLLSNILNQDGTRICHLGVLPQRLGDLKVFIILDDVNNLKQLEALAGDISWFGLESRIIVTTEDQELLQQHGIDNIYHVSFPSSEEACNIFCRYAFKPSSQTKGFEKLAKRMTKLCGKLPLGLRVVGSSLRGKKEEEWEDAASRLETIIDQNIEKVLKVGYESLDDNEKTLFLYIAIFFNYKDGDLVKAMLAGSDLDVKNGLKILVRKSLIEISTNREIIVMHRLLQQVGRKAIRRQKPRNRQILIDANDICDVLRNDTVTNKVVGLSLDTTAINVVFRSKGAFKRMHNLQFLKVIKSKDDGNDRMDIIPEEMEIPQRLRLLHWESYPSKCLPPKFQPEYLVELDFRNNQFEKLWEGTQPLTNLKQMDLRFSYSLKELPELSNAKNLETLKLSGCVSLVELPSSVSNLETLKDLWMVSCSKLEVTPTNWRALAPLELVYIGTNMTTFGMSVPAVKEAPPSITLSSPREFSLTLCHNQKLKTLTQLPTTITSLDLCYCGIETICCIKGLHMLETLLLRHCTKLKSLPELPGLLKTLCAKDCESLGTVFCPFNTPLAQLNFTNCFKLSQQARRAIIQQQSLRSCLPGSQVPAEFDHRAMGNTLTFPISAFSQFKVCLVYSPNDLTESYSEFILLCRRIRKGYSYPSQKIESCEFSRTYQPKQLFVFHSKFLHENGCLERSGEIMFEFTSKFNHFDILECGALIFKDGSSNVGSSDDDGGNNHWDTHESIQESYDEEESGRIIDKISESESYKDDDEGITDGDYKSVSRKRPRKTKMTNDDTTLKWGIQRRRF